MEAYNIIERHYTETYDEDRHLSSREGQVDFFVTFTWIERVIASLCSELGKKALNILEIGAGTGAYSLELARQCHHVVASDLLPQHIECIRQRANGTLEANVDDARDLSRYEDCSFDVVLCFGPMYHLFSDEDIKAAAFETLRVCRAGGYILFTYLPQDSIVISYCLRHGKFSECYGETLSEDFVPAVLPEEIFRGFYIDEFNKIMKAFGNLTHLHTVATDGLSRQLREHVGALSDEDFELWKQYCLLTCEKPELQGFSNHILWIGRKNTD